MVATTRHASAGSSAARRRPDAPAPGFVVVLPGALDDAGCLKLRDLVDLGEDAEDGRTKAGEQPAIRRSRVAWVPETPAWHWIEERMTALLVLASRQLAFDLDGFDERLQVARYDAETRGGFDWHGDRARSGLGARRKLSISIQLSAPAEYDGGLLEMFADGRRWRAPRGQGTAIVFASFLSHRVTPVVRGLRYSLVAWAHGPDFR